MAGMTRTTRTGLFVLGFLAATGVEAVRADEAYLCEDGRIVKVAPGQLEVLKRTDACIAAYYGLKIEAAPPIETGAIAPAARRSPAADPPPALNKETRPAATAATKPAATAASKPAATVASKSTRIAIKSTAPSGPPRAAAGTDYRNVVVLNAGPGQPAIYRHEH